MAATGAIELQVLTGLHALGAREEAFELIDQTSFARIFDPDGPKPAATGAHTGFIFSLSFNGPMMRDPRFVRLCAKLGLVDYWMKSGRWPDCADEGVPPYDFKAEALRLAAA